MEKTILITIDVEDWFQVENFKPWIPFSTWDSHELRVEKNTHRLLNLFDSIELQPPSLPTSQLQAHKNEPSANSYELAGDSKPKAKGANENAEDLCRRRIDSSQFHQETENEKNKFQKSSRSCLNKKIENNPASRTQHPVSSQPKATFFVLGWLAERLPHLVREIQARGHEVASHGLSHELCNKMSKEDLNQDLIDSKKRLEDILGAEVYGFRAPSFAINDSVLKTIEDCGFLYDSSYNSFGLHGRYGHISLNGSSRKGIAHRINENFFELPISNLKFAGQTLPWGGGGYFRLLPWRAFKSGVNLIIKKEKAYLFYIHPWEIDHDQPLVNKALYKYRFRHYKNLKKTTFKLSRLIKEFSQCKFVTCSHYLNFEPFSIRAL